MGVRLEVAALIHNTIHFQHDSLGISNIVCLSNVFPFLPTFPDSGGINGWGSLGNASDFFLNCDRVTKGTPHSCPFLSLLSPSLLRNEVFSSIVRHKGSPSNFKQQTTFRPIIWVRSSPSVIELLLEQFSVLFCSQFAWISWTPPVLCRFHKIKKI